jgi:hypothetical protein
VAVVPITLYDWVPAVSGGAFDFYLEKVDATLGAVGGGDKVALVAHSAGGWLARIFLGSVPYNGAHAVDRLGLSSYDVKWAMWRGVGRALEGLGFRVQRRVRSSDGPRAVLRLQVVCGDARSGCRTWSRWARRTSAWSGTHSAEWR